MKYEDIARANESIKTTPIKGKNYAEVNQRIKAFRMNHPEGSIVTEIICPDDPVKEGYVVIKATVAESDGTVLASDVAYEVQNSTFINKTSFIENCSTSAVGRALGYCGYGIDTSVASFEEVQIAEEKRALMETVTKVQAKTIIDLAAQKGVSGQEFLDHFGIEKTLDMTAKQYGEAVKWLDSMEDA